MAEPHSITGQQLDDRNAQQSESNLHETEKVQPGCRSQLTGRAMHSDSFLPDPKVISRDATNAKASYNRAKANALIGDTDRAREDLKNCDSADPQACRLSLVTLSPGEWCSRL